MMNISITDWNMAKELVSPIRYRVFVLEQQVPEDLEWDEYDEVASHAVAQLGGQVIGTGRLILDYTVARIGRMAVDEKY